MRRHHVAPEPLCRQPLTDRLKGGGNPGHIRRIHLGEAVGADGPMRQQNGFRHTAGGRGIGKRLQHDRRHRKE